MNEELLFNEIYERTKNFSRVDFVKLLMLKENGNNRIKNQQKELIFNNKRISKIAEDRYDRILELENDNKKLKQNISYYLDWLEKEVHNYKSSLFNHAIAYRNSYSILVLGGKINIFDKGDKNAERVCF